MGGRGGQGFQSSRGSGRGTRHYDNTKYKSQEQHKSLYDYVYHIGLAKQASDYVIVTKHLLNHICRTCTFGDDIANALVTQTEMDFTMIMPKLQVSMNPNADEKDQEDQEFSMLYRAKITSYITREDKYRSGNACAFLFGQCNKAMQSKLQARTDFAITIKNNPIELLKAIEEHTISYQENKYEMGIIMDALRNLVNLKQRTISP